MKPVLSDPAAKKAMRVATAVTGVTAFAAAFAPMPAGQAASRPKPPALGPHAGHGMRVREVRGHQAVLAGLHEPYSLSVYMRPSVYAFHVCGWKHVGGGQWTCTGNYADPYLSDHWFNVGGNWNRGKISVRWNAGGRGSWDECKTNSGGFWGVSNSAETWVGLYGNSARGIGFGTPTC